MSQPSEQSVAATDEQELDTNNTVLYLELESRDTQGSNIKQSWKYLHRTP